MYKSILEEQFYNSTFVCRSQASFSKLDLADEELDIALVKRRSSIILDDASTESDITDTDYEIDFGESDRWSTPYAGLHKKLCSDSNVMFVLKELDIKEPRALKTRHKRAPTCPPDLFNRTSLATCETESITDTECSEPHDLISDWTSLLGKDVILNTKLKSLLQIPYCHDPLLSISKDQSNFETPFSDIERMSSSNVVDTCSIRKNSFTNIKQKAFRQLLVSPMLYISVAFTLGGLMFTIGACPLRLSLPVTQNIFLVGSSMYFFGCIGILYRTWKDTSDEWDLLQEIRNMLHTMVYLDIADKDLEVKHHYL